MPICSKCKSWSPDGSPVCHNCGRPYSSEVDSGPAQNYARPAATQVPNDAQERSLAKAYWGYFIFGGGIIGIAGSIVIETTVDPFPFVAKILMFGYAWWACFAVWIAADSARSKTWSALARLHAVGATVLGTLLFFAAFLGVDSFDKSIDTGQLQPPPATPVAPPAPTLTPLPQEMAINFHTMVEEFERKYPLIDPNSNIYDQQQADLVVARVAAHESSGVNPLHALRMAAKEIANVELKLPPARSTAPTKDLPLVRAPHSKVGRASSEPYYEVPGTNYQPPAQTRVSVEPREEPAPRPKLDYGTPYRLRSWAEMKGSTHQPESAEQ